MWCVCVTQLPRMRLLRNTRTTDSLPAAKSAEFLLGLAPPEAACALLRNTRTTDSLRRFGTVCFSIAWRRNPAAFALALSLMLGLAPLPAQSVQPAADEGYRVYTESPRLLLGPQRLRLLKRERERKSMRWEHFETLMAGGARMPEPGLALGLYAIVTGSAPHSRRAIEWAMQPSATVQHTAMIYDWLRPSLTPAQAKALESRLARAASTPSDKLTGIRDRVYAAIALGDADAKLSEKVLREVVVDWWRGKLTPALAAGKPVVARTELYPFFEILHVIRDNLHLDLREDALDYFKRLPGNYLLGHYPAPFPAAENEYRIPAYPGPGDPDVSGAVFSRAAGLAMVAYDNNARDSQFLQGWLLMDHFLLRGALGVPYEFMWANPYQPGLSYFHFGLRHHDPRTGELLLRSSWEDDATWFGVVKGQFQLFTGGKITLMNPKLKQPVIEIGPSRLILAPERLQFRMQAEEAGMTYVLGLDPRTRYNVEVDDEEMYDADTDPGGTLTVPMTAGMNAGVRLLKQGPGATAAASRQ